MPLKECIQDDTKAAMRAKDKDRLATLRLVSAAIKQREVDERISLNDNQIIAVLERMLKQRRESITQYRTAGRDDLVAKETFELEIIQAYMPTALDDITINRLIDGAIANTSAQSLRDMGKVMALIKDQVQGRADMADISARVKARLA